VWNGGNAFRSKDLKYLGSAYGAFFVAVPFFMLRVKRAALSGAKNIKLSSVWTVFIGYQMVRFAAFTIRVAQLQRRNDLENTRETQ